MSSSALQCTRGRASQIFLWWYISCNITVAAYSQYSTGAVIVLHLITNSRRALVLEHCDAVFHITEALILSEHKQKKWMHIQPGTACLLYINPQSNVSSLFFLLAIDFNYLNYIKWVYCSTHLLFYCFIAVCLRKAWGSGCTVGFIAYWNWMIFVTCVSFDGCRGSWSIAIEMAVIKKEYWRCFQSKELSVLSI